MPACKRLTACFAGTRLEALQALARYANTVSILTVADSWVHRHCRSNGLAVELISRERRADGFRFLASQPVDLVLSAGFPFIVPGWVLQGPATFVNSHPSLLPAYRGYASITEAFKHGEEYMGVSVHYIAEELDAGPVIHQERVRVKGLALQEIYDLLFRVVEPLAITKAMEILLKSGSVAVNRL